jgi:hypothetical protein
VFIIKKRSPVNGALITYIFAVNYVREETSIEA